MRRLTAILALAVSAWLPAAASADQWLPPRTQTYYSANRQWRLTVRPRAIRSPLAYFEDKITHKADAGSIPGNLQKQAHGYLEHLADGRWTPVWNAPLVNEVAPVEAVVSDQGYTATFDNWHSMGHGPNVVVIYDLAGHKVSNLALADILPKPYIRALPHSASSIAWGNDHHFSADGRLILHIVVPPDPAIEPHPAITRYVELAIDTRTGRVIPPRGAAWARAWQAAQLADAKLSAAEAAADAAFKAPLQAPTTGLVTPWHRYMIEAFFRLDSEWKDGYPQTVVLGNRSDPDYARYRAILAEALTSPIDDRGAIMIGSPDPANLLKVLDKLTRALPLNHLPEARIYVTIPATLRETASIIIARTGATFIPLNIDVAIPQRPERLQQ